MMPNDLGLIKNEFGFDEDDAVKKCSILFNLTVAEGIEIPRETMPEVSVPSERTFILPNSDGDIIARVTLQEKWVDRNYVSYENISLQNGEGKEVANFGTVSADFFEKGGDKPSTYFVVRGGGGSVGFSCHDNKLEITGYREVKEQGMIKNLPEKEILDLSSLKGTSSNLVTVKEVDGEKKAEVHIDYKSMFGGQPANDHYQVSFDENGFMKIDVKDHVVGTDEAGTREKTVYMEDGQKSVTYSIWADSIGQQEHGGKERIDSIVINPAPNTGAERVYFFDEKSHFEGIGYGMDRSGNFQQVDIVVKDGDTPGTYVFERHDTSTMETRRDIFKGMAGETLMEGTIKLDFEREVPQSEIQEARVVKDGYEPDDFTVEKEPEPEKKEKWEESDHPMKDVFLGELGEFHGDDLHLFDVEGKGGTVTYTEYQGFLHQQDVEVTSTGKVDSFTDGNGNKVTMTEDMMLDKNPRIGKDDALGYYPGRGGLFVDIERPDGSKEQYYAGERGKIYFTIGEDGSVSVGNEKYHTIRDACNANGDNRDVDANARIRDFSKDVKGIEMTRLSDLGLGVITTGNDRKELQPMEKVIVDSLGTQTSTTQVDYIKLEKAFMEEIKSLGVVSPDSEKALLSIAPKVVDMIRSKEDIDDLKKGDFLTPKEKTALRNALVDRHVYMNCFQTGKGDMLDSRAKACVGFDMAAAKMRYSVDTIRTFVGKEIGKALEGTGHTVKDVLDAVRDGKELSGPMEKVAALAEFYSEVKAAAAEAIPAVKEAAGKDFAGGAYMPGVSESSVVNKNEGTADSLHSRFQVNHLEHNRDKIEEGGKVVEGFKAAFTSAVDACNGKLGGNLDNMFTSFCSDLKGMGYTIQDNCILSPIGLDRNGNVHFKEGAVEAVEKLAGVGNNYNTNPNYVEFRDDREIIDPTHEVGANEYSSAVTSLTAMNEYESHEPIYYRVMSCIEAGVLPNNMISSEEGAKQTSPLDVLRDIDKVIAYNTDFDTYSHVDKEIKDFLEDFAKDPGKDRVDKDNDRVDKDNDRVNKGADHAGNKGAFEKNEAGTGRTASTQASSAETARSKYSIYDKNDMNAMEKIGRSVLWRADLVGVGRDYYTDKMEHHIAKRNEFIERNPFMPYYRQNTFFAYHEWRAIANARVSGVAINGHIPTWFDTYSAYSKFINTSIFNTLIETGLRKAFDRIRKEKAYRTYHDIYKREDRVGKDGKPLSPDGIARDKEGQPIVIARITDPVQRRFLGLPPLDEKGRPVDDSGIPKNERLEKEKDNDDVERSGPKKPHRPYDNPEDILKKRGADDKKDEVEKKTHGKGASAKVAFGTFLVAGFCSLAYGGKAEAKDLEAGLKSRTAVEQSMEKKEAGRQEEKKVDRKEGEQTVGKEEVSSGTKDNISQMEQKEDGADGKKEQAAKEDMDGKKDPEKDAAKEEKEKDLEKGKEKDLAGDSEDKEKLEANEDEDDKVEGEEEGSEEDPDSLEANEDEEGKVEEEKDPEEDPDNLEANEDEDDKVEGEEEDPEEDPDSLDADEEEDDKVEGEEDPEEDPDSLEANEDEEGKVEEEKDPEEDPDNLEANEDEDDKVEGEEEDPEEDPDSLEADEEEDDKVEGEEDPDEDPDNLEANEDEDDKVEGEEEDPEKDPDSLEADEDGDDKVEGEEDPDNLEADHGEKDPEEDLMEKDPDNMDDPEEEPVDQEEKEEDPVEKDGLEAGEEGTEDIVEPEGEETGVVKPEESVSLAEKDKGDDSDILVAANTPVQEKEEEKIETEPEEKTASMPDQGAEAAVETETDGHPAEPVSAEEAPAGQVETGPEHAEPAVTEAVEQGSVPEEKGQKQDIKEMATGDSKEDDETPRGGVDAIVDAFTDFLENMGTSGNTFGDFLEQPIFMDNSAQPVTIAEAIGTLMADGNSPIAMMEETLAGYIAGVDITADNSAEGLMQAASVGIDLTSIAANDDTGYIDPMQSLETITGQAEPAAADAIFVSASDFMEPVLWQMDYQQDSLGLQDMDLTWIDSLQTEDIFHDGFAEDVYGQIYDMETMQDPLAGIDTSGFDMAEELQRMNETTQQMEEEARRNIPEIKIEIPDIENNMENNQDNDMENRGEDRAQDGPQDVESQGSSQVPYYDDYDPVD